MTDFIKHPIITSPYAHRGGFGVMVNDTINCLSYLDREGILLMPHFKWDDKGLLFYQKDKGNNVWDYYFNNNMIGSQHELFDPMHDTSICNDKKWSDLYYININQCPNLDKDKLLRLNRIYKKYITIKTDIVEDLNFYIEKNWGKNTLGIHYRLTDKTTEGVTQVSINKLVDVIKKETPKYDTIFLATDYIPAIEASKNLDKVVFLNNIRSPNNTGVHFMPGNNYLKGLECLKDMVLLSMCNSFLFSRSNLSLTSLIISGLKYDRVELLSDCSVN